MDFLLNDNNLRHDQSTPQKIFVRIDCPFCDCVDTMLLSPGHGPDGHRLNAQPIYRYEGLKSAKKCEEIEI